MPCIDLIIPMYNSERYIPELIHCLQQQTFKDFRVIFVDDGSSDSTYSLLENVLKEAGFLYLLLKQENKGPSAARNHGMRYAEADWICFSDSDDALLPEYLEYMYRAVQYGKAEMGFCRYHAVFQGTDEQSISAGELTYRFVTAEEAMKIHYSRWIAPVCLILETKWMKQHNIHFDEQCRYCEDLMFITQCIAVANHVCELQNELYVYYQHEGSLLRSGNTNKYLDGLEGFKRLEKSLVGVDTDAVQVFHRMGWARFLLANLRRAALQLSWKEFCAFAKVNGYEKYHYQIKNLPVKQQMAAYLYMISKPLFYGCINFLFKD